MVGAGPQRDPLKPVLIPQTRDQGLSGPLLNNPPALSKRQRVEGLRVNNRVRFGPRKQPFPDLGVLGFPEGQRRCALCLRMARCEDPS